MLLFNSEINVANLLNERALSTQELYDLNINLVELLVEIHKQQQNVGSFHPQNIIYSHNKYFVQRSSLSEEHLSFYKAPELFHLKSEYNEQTDLYSLGVLMYYMYSGEHPILPKANQSWGEAHLFNEINPIINSLPILNQIIIKLLHKTPSKRYQSAFGLLADLKKVIHTNSDIAVWDVGEVDSKLLQHNNFNLPLQTHMVEKIEWCIEQFSNIETSIIAVRGEVQSGKTKALKEISNRLNEHSFKVYYVSCSKQNNRTYDVIKRMIASYFETVASYTPAEIEDLINRISSDRLININYVKHVFPRFKSFIDFVPITKVKPLLLIESRQFDDINEHEQLVAILDSLNERIKHPISWCIDNIDYLDDQNIEQFFSVVNSVKKAMIVVFTHSNSKDFSLDVSFLQLQIKPLIFEEVFAIISKLLSKDSAYVRLITQGALSRSRGNIGELKKLVLTWIKEELLYFDGNKLRWKPSDELLGNQRFEDEIIQFMKRKFDDIDPDVQKVVAVASLIGKRVNPLLIADVFEYSLQTVYAAMEQVEAVGLVYYDRKDIQDENRSSEYIFLHDELRLYFQTIIEEEVIEWHYKIGLIIYDKYKDILQNSIEKCMYHFNCSHSLISEEGLANLVFKNLEIGLLHLEEQKFTEAGEYLTKGLQLCLYYGKKFDQYVYKFMLYLGATQYVRGQVEQAAETFETLSIHKDKLEPSDLRKYYMWQMEIAALDNHEESLRYGLEALKLYNWEIPKKVSTASVLKEFILTQRMLKQYKEGNISTQSNTSEEFKTLCRIAYSISSSLGIINPIGMIHFYARFLRFALREGMNIDLAITVSIYEIALQRGAQELFNLMPTDTFSYIVDKECYDGHQVYFVNAILKQLHRPEDLFTYLMVTINKAIKVNDYRSVNLALMVVIICFNEDMNKLKELLLFIDSEISTYIDVKMYSLLEEFRSYYEANVDENKLSSYIATDYTLEQQHINYISMNRAEMSLIANDFRRALYWTNYGEQTFVGVNWIQNRKIMLYKHLAMSALYHNVEDTKEKRYFKTHLKAFLRKMKKWEGFLGYETSVYYLIYAEYSYILNDQLKAQTYYEKCITLAKKEKNGKVEAYALERLSFFFSSLGSETGELIALMDAISAYTKFGMQSKVNILNQQIKNKDQQDTILNRRNKEVLTLEQINVENHQVTSQFNNSEYHLQQIYELKGHWNNQDFINSFLSLACRQVAADYGVLIQYDNRHFNTTASYGLFEKNIIDSYSQSVLHYCVNTMESYNLVSALGKESMINNVENPFKSLLAIPIRSYHRQEVYILVVASHCFDHIFNNQEELVVELLLSRFIYLAEREQLSSKQVTSYLQTSVQASILTTLLEPLTERELDVLKEIVNGLTNVEISEKLNIKTATVKTHINNVYSKLAVKRRAQAIMKAKEMNLV